MSFLKLLDEIGFGKFQVMLHVCLCGIFLIDGSELLLATVLVGALQQHFGLTDMEKGAMASMVFTGALIGGLIGGFLSDKVGRRPAMLAT